MYLESVDPNSTTELASLRSQRSLAGDFVFVSQDDSVSFLVESCIHVLQRTNQILDRESYRWSHLRNAQLEELTGAACGPDQTLVLVGGVQSAWRLNPKQTQLLRAAIRNAVRVCVIGAAVFVPLAAGVLGAKRLAVHPSFEQGVLETNGSVEVHPGTTCHHKSVSSATGPAAAMRMMVELVSAREGTFAGLALSRDLGLTETKGQCGTGEYWRFQRMSQGDEVIQDALQMMEDHLEDTISVGQIANIVGVSPRKLERGFRDRFGRSPLKVYRDLRLDRAHQLMTQTTMPPGEVSVACGFSNVTLMKRWFYRKYGQLPSDVRQHAFSGTDAASPTS